MFPEHIQESGPGQFIELGQGGPAFGPEGLGPVQDVGDAPLLGE